MVIAHAADWLSTALYTLPLAVIVLMLVREKRREGRERAEPGDQEDAIDEP